MPYSYSFFKEDFKFHLIANIDKNCKFLDVGAGSGSYGLLLKTYFENIDALEIFSDYVYEFELHEVYKNVYVSDIMDFNIKKYDYFIFGDIIEHLSIEDATNLLNYVNMRKQKCMVAIPFEMEQGEEHGNIHETHLQPDLTNEIFIERYPFMKLLFKNDLYGYYINYDCI
jgi:hypothetical protein